MTDPLALYNAKRDFTKTAEPAGTLAPGHGNGFIVQKHDATRLHWDFRLEVDGVLKSWAVTRGPSLDPDEKRLAVRTEDHPLSYATFEGTIPAGEYGGGTVMLWDRGTWAPIKGKSAADIDKGHLHFVLDGERMKGEWLLIRLKPRGREKRENWLLRKIADGFAGGTDMLTEDALTSIATGRTMAEIAENKPAGRKAAASPKAPGRGKAKKTTLPDFRSPALCTLVDHVPPGNAWVHEMKYDGYRALIAVAGGTARVFTRNGLDWTDKFSGIAEAAAALPVTSALIDGEIVAFKQGRPDFSTLKDAIGSGGAMTLFAFDLIEQDGEDLTALPLVQRKARLQPLVTGSDDRLLYAEHIVGAGEQLFASLCGEGMEGVVSKRADSPYPNGRSNDWLKIKCLHRQEFVIIGWLPSDKRRGFRSLLLGVHRDGELRYAGKVGTGFTQDAMTELRTELDARPVDAAPVKAPRAMTRGARWVKPELVAEIAFTEMTPDGLLRHPSFLGLR
uniref:non-homologous end-joining DNA ligase n=1 Tax=uncultured Sphingomonas sp. TaxID=158754 RepID=UPI00262E35DC